jgi:hypothetical protein
MRYIRKTVIFMLAAVRTWNVTRSNTLSFLNDVLIAYPSNLCDCPHWSIIIFVLFLMSMGWDFLQTATTSGPIVHPAMIYEHGEQQWNDINRGKPNNSEKNRSQYHTVHLKSDMDDSKTRASGVRCRGLTAWAMTGPVFILLGNVYW